MRLIGSVRDRRLAQEFSYYLVKEGIENHFEPSREGDQEVFLIWIVDEDEVERANEEYEALLANPDNPKFHGHYREAKRIEEARLEKLREHRAADEAVSQRAQTLRRPLGVLTIALIIASALLLFWSSLDVIPIKDNGEQAIIIAKPPYSTLLFDFPKPFQLFDQLATQYPKPELEDPSQLPASGRALLREALALPYWQGFYTELVAKLNPEIPDKSVSAPLFGKISEGEVWRLVTPAILHLDIIHLLFNMIWLFVLGTQVEGRVGRWRFILLILVAALVTNVSQYAMSGPLFMGMSGVVCVLFGFIWMRQRRSPWEGYQLHRITIAFIVAFIVAMLIFQLVSFGFEISGKTSIGPPIANTAHIVGLILGALLGRLDLFAYHAVKPR